MAVTQQHRVAELAAEIVDSFEKLEALLRLDRVGTAVPLERLVAEIALDRVEVSRALDELVAAGVVRLDPAGYAIVQGGNWTEHVRALCDLHKADRMEVVTIMSKASVERLRRQAARAFADAFVVRAPKKGDGDG